MKKTIIILCLGGSILHADLSIKQIEERIKKIHLKREGISLETLENTKEPFVKPAKEDNVSVIYVSKKKKEVVLSLHAIMANKAFINESWKKEGDKILGYTVKYIGNKGVVLKNGNTIKKLFLGKPKDDFITIKEREE